MTAKKGEVESAQKKSRRSAVKKKQDFLDIFQSALTNISLSCKMVGISRETYYRWRSEDKVFNAACYDIEESLLDKAEATLYKAVNEGNTTELIFYLKTKGKKRGYVEQVQTDMNILNNIGFKIGLQEEE